VLVNPAK
jgi:2-phosphosulfolactate phosphatase